MSPPLHIASLTLAVIATLAGCGFTTGVCNEQPPVAVPFDMLPDPPEGSDWSLAEMRAGIEGTHRGTIYPIDTWDDQPEGAAPESFTEVIVEARLLPEAELIEHEAGPGEDTNCSQQQVVLYAEIEFRIEGGEVLGTADRVGLSAAADDAGTGGSFFVPPNEAIATVLGEDTSTLPDSIQVNVGFGFDPESQHDPVVSMSGLDETGSTRPLAQGRLETHEPLDE